MFQFIVRKMILIGLAGWLAGNVYADPSFIDRSDVQAFITHMVTKHDFDKPSLIALFSSVQIRPQVIQNVNKPLEKEPWLLYQLLFVSEWRIEHGVEFWNKHQATLAAAEKEYGVPANIIVATIGIETRYGEKNGEYRVIDSLSNLAFSDSPRAPFFKKELEEFLLLSREENLDTEKLMGSYAGAIGQPQFMPSSYRFYAVNFSKSGKIDLINDEADVIGSVANYYYRHGWTPHQPVAIQALVDKDRFEDYLKNANQNQPLTLAELAQYGITPKEKISQDHLKMKLTQLDSKLTKEYWLGFPNFDVIRRYNASDLYAMAVYQLSQYITEARIKSNKES